VLAIYLKPVLPEMAAKVETFFDSGELQWRDSSAPLLESSIKPYEPLMLRIDAQAVDKMVEASKQQSMTGTEASGL
jgi:methionyl-tRNA synthetase